MSTKQNQDKSKASHSPADKKSVRAEFIDHMVRQLWLNHAFRGTTVIYGWRGTTLHLRIPNKKTW